MDVCTLIFGGWSIAHACMTEKCHEEKGRKLCVPVPCQSGSFIPPKYSCVKEDGTVYEYTPKLRLE
jgi:hypothetical protein